MSTARINLLLVEASQLNHQELYEVRDWAEDVVELAQELALNLDLALKLVAAYEASDTAEMKTLRSRLGLK